MNDLYQLEHSEISSLYILKQNNSKEVIINAVSKLGSNSMAITILSYIPTYHGYFS